VSLFFSYAQEGNEGERGERWLVSKHFVRTAS